MKKIKIKSRKLGRERAHGLYWEDKELIEIDPRLNGKDKFSSLVHELNHAAFPEKTEWEIKVATRLISEHLWAEGYRKIK